MRFLKVSLIALLAIAFVVGSTGCKTVVTPPPPAAEKLKVAFVYPSPHNDGGWSQAEEAGRLYLQQNDPNVETTYSENIPEGSQAEKTFRDYASAGYDLIFGASFGYMDAMVNAAKDNPTVKFMHSAGYKRSDNLGTVLWPHRAVLLPFRPYCRQDDQDQQDRLCATILHLSVHPPGRLLDGRRARSQSQGYRHRRLHQRVVRPHQGR